MLVVCCAFDYWSALWRPQGLDEVPKSSITSGGFAPQRCSRRWWSSKDEALPGNGWGAWAKCLCGCMFGWWWWTSAPLCCHCGVSVQDPPFVMSPDVELPGHYGLLGPRLEVTELSRLHQPRVVGGLAKSDSFALAPDNNEGPCTDMQKSLTTFSTFPPREKDLERNQL